jgi:Fic family protein
MTTNAHQFTVLSKSASNDTQNIVTRISTLHLAFEHTHPFVDGNGRIGRVINNYLLIRAGYVPINIKFINRAQYYDAFSEYDLTGKVKKMEEIVYKALLNWVAKYFHTKLSHHVHHQGNCFQSLILNLL